MNNADLTKAGLKITLPRIKILQLLENARDRHLSAEDIYRMLIESGEDIGLATVYRVLTQFEEAHLVIRHNFTEGHSVFELDSGDHHDHLICVKCSHVEEFVDSEIEERQRHVAKKAGYNILYHNFNIYGVCGNCQII